MPQTTCVVPNCTYSGDHIIPKDKTRRDAWIHAIRRAKEDGKSKFGKWEPNSKYSYICRNHFTENDYVTLTYHGQDRQKRTLKKTAVPSVFTWAPAVETESSKARAKRSEARSVKRRRLFQDSTNQEPIYFAQKFQMMDADDIGASETVGSSADYTSDDTENTEQMDAVQMSMVDVASQTPKQAPYDIHNFEKDPVGVRYFTGLENYVKFSFVLNSLGPAAYHLNYVYHHVSNISVPNQLFMVLIKLRRHTPNYELGRMFGIAESVVSNVFITWVIFMEKQWKEINIWPNQEQVRYFAPTGFKRCYPNTRVIVDGTECPVKKPKNPTSQQATFSTYKNRNTVKTLVGVTPGGLVSYISPAYGGSTSDRQIVERSNMINMCDPKDSIMADKGFNVQDLFAARDVHVNIPTFFKKKNRMTGETVLRDRKISSKRVHVERVIGLAKTYRILVEPMTATETKLSSKIIYICFMLCNFRSRIIPKYA